MCLSIRRIIMGKINSEEIVVDRNSPAEYTEIKETGGDNAVSDNAGLVMKTPCRKVVDQVNLERMIQAQNWDGSKIQIRLKDSTEWGMWDRYNRKHKIHPTQKVFTEAEFLPEQLRRR